MAKGFEKAGLGKAPFDCIGYAYTVRKVKAGADIIVYPTGQCAYCGSALMHSYLVQSSDGKKFTVGCSCVKKCGEGDVLKQVKTLRKKAERENAQEVIDGAKALLASSENVEAVLNFEPHPSYLGESLLNYVNWIFENAGLQKKLDIASTVLDYEGTQATEAQLKLLKRDKAHKALVAAEIALEQANIEAEKLAAKARIESSIYVGTVGKRQEFTATVVKRITGQSGYGYWTLTTLVDEEDNTLKYWNDINIKDSNKTNSCGLYEWAEVGCKVTFKATVKGQELETRDEATNGTRCTVLSRASKAVKVS